MVLRKATVNRCSKGAPLLGFLFFSSLIIISFAQLLPEEEVQILEKISAELQNSYWNVSRSSCRDGTGFNVFFADRILSNVTCDCSFSNNTVCHIITIELKGLNLTGTLPAVIANLTHLTELDLSRNYINGSIPAVFSQLPLTILALLGNRISGRIPEEIGDIRALEQLVLEDNLLGGSLPKSLGRLSNLSRLLLSANNFTGPIPETYGNLKNLNDLRLDGSAISGKIPDFIGNWTNLGRLDMQGTLLEGPIPSTISALKRLTNLRILDLNASSMAFPNLEGMKSMKILILRNCSIVGELPAYIGGMTNLKTLDLSYNLLTGPIPNTLPGLNFDNIFLAANSFTGVIPPALLNSRQNVDLSYNNFTGTSATSCISTSINLVSSYSSSTDILVPWCSKKDLPCSDKIQFYSLFINCGGGRTVFDGNSYEQDLHNEGPSYFYSSTEKWAYSSSGVFMGFDDANYIATNSFSLNITGPEFYKTARLSPSSLKYYGLCLRKGSYRVRLHFAEIMYSNDTHFSSIGKRIFHVSIQGKVVLQDFNIMEEAGGVGIGITKDFNDVLVNGSTLEIHLYWTGKGTTAIPDRGVYGPLISAITVTPNFDTSTGLSTRAIIGVVVALCIFVGAVISVILVLRMKGYLGGRSAEDQELRSLDLQTGYFTLRQIKAATKNFDPLNKIGEGGFGPVYKGILADGAVIAVKQLSSKSKQGNREFITEIGMISAQHHPNLVKLYGYCIEGNHLMLVYEYMENNSLARALFEQSLNLDWETRKKISIGIARGLAFLHEESRIKIVHRDIKASNVLLDKDLNAKISDFGLAKLNEDENTHISTRIAGTIGYMAPEYAMRGYLTDKADVYSFGIVMLEIVSGKSNTNYRPKEEFVYLLDWAYVLQEQGNLLELVDPSLGDQYSPEEARMMLNVALLCTNPSPTLRPSMSSVVKMLKGEIPVQASLIKRTTSKNGDARFKAFKSLSQDSEINVSAINHRSQEQRSMSGKGPWIDYSSSSSLIDKDQISGYFNLESCYNEMMMQIPKKSDDSSSV